MNSKFDKPGILSRILMALILFLTTVPLLWLLLISLKTNNEIMLEPLKLPQTLNLENYKTVLAQIPFLRMAGNTLFVLVITLPLELLLTALAGFAISRNRSVSKKFRGRLRTVFVCGLIIPASVMLYPIFFLMTRLHLDNTLWSLIIVHLGWSAPLGVMNMINAFDAIPDSLEEAAILDGCNVWQLFVRVLMPMIKPAIATLAIIYALGIWNDFLLSRTLLTGVEHRTISLAAMYFKGEFSINYATMSAGAVVLIVPQLLIYVLLQKFIISGSFAGAVKG